MKRLRAYNIKIGREFYGPLSLLSPSLYIFKNIFSYVFDKFFYYINDNKNNNHNNHKSY